MLKLYSTKLFVIVACGMAALAAAQTPIQIRSVINPLNRSTVRQALKLTDEQAKKIDTELKEAQSNLREAIREALSGGAMSKDEADELAAKAVEKNKEESEARIAKILTLDQRKRLKEITIQIEGPAVVCRRDIGKEVGLTEAQRTKILAVIAKSNEPISSYISASGGSADKEAMSKLMKEQRTKLNAEIGKILTSDQKSKLKEMEGKPFIKRI